MDTKEGKNDVDKVIPEIELKAVELKFYGFEYKDIEAQLKEDYPDIYPSAKLLRDWFCKGGKLHDYYVNFAKNQAEENLKEGRQMMKAYAKQAMQVIVSLMKKSKNDRVRLEAGKELVSRGYGQVQKILIEKNNDFVDDILFHAGLLDDKETNERTEDTTTP